MKRRIGEIPSFSGSVLSSSMILEEIENENITITPFDKDAVGPGSVDLSLGYEFRLYKEPSVIDIKEDTDYTKYTTVKLLKSKDEYIELKPLESCLGVTLEEVDLSNKYCGFLSGRSRFARVGLFIHFASNYINPGCKNRTVLEIFNASNQTLRLYPEVKVCQIVFLRVEGKSRGYKGKFYEQEL